MLLQPITKHAKNFSNSFNETASISKKMTTVALLSSLSAILQSAGGFIPIVGFFISPFATAPVIVSTIISPRYGFLGYILTIILLVIILPSELLVFTFTTGFLGIGLGISFHLWKRRLSLIMTGALPLLCGILIVLFFFQFPLLGPSIHANASFGLFFSLAFFSFLYSWIWVELSLLLLKRIQR